MSELYPLRTILCEPVRAQSNVATGPRALEYGSGLSAGDGVRITIATQNADMVNSGLRTASAVGHET